MLGDLCLQLNAARTARGGWGGDSNLEMEDTRFLASGSSRLSSDDIEVGESKTDQLARQVEEQQEALDALKKQNCINQAGTKSWRLRSVCVCVALSVTILGVVVAASATLLFLSSQQVEVIQGRLDELSEDNLVLHNMVKEVAQRSEEYGSRKSKSMAALETRNHLRSDGPTKTKNLNSEMTTSTVAPVTVSPEERRPAACTDMSSSSCAVLKDSSTCTGGWSLEVARGEARLGYTHR